MMRLRLTMMVAFVAAVHATMSSALPPAPLQSLEKASTTEPTTPTTEPTTQATVGATGGVDTVAQGPLNRRLTMLAFADDGDSALLFERSGGAVVTEAVWIVDDSGVREILPLGSRLPSAVMPSDTEDCFKSAERLAAMARDYDMISVRVGMCSHPSRQVVTSLKNQGSVIVSAEVGKLHQKVGFPGRTFISHRSKAHGVGAFVVVLGEDIFGNDTVGVTRR
jgi:hypothetical protein